VRYIIVTSIAILQRRVNINASVFLLVVFNAAVCVASRNHSASQEPSRNNDLMSLRAYNSWLLVYIVVDGNVLAGPKKVTKRNVDDSRGILFVKHACDCCT
jgi:hypothetical protein